MLEVHGLDVEVHLPIGNAPALRQRILFPVAAAFRTAGIPCVARLPFGVALRRVPDDLRIRPDKIEIAPSLQSLAAGTL